MTNEVPIAGTSPSTPERPAPNTGVADVAGLVAVQQAQMILQDAATFLRNNHMVYTASLARAMREIADGNQAGQELLKSLESVLKANDVYLKNAIASCGQLVRQFAAATDPDR